MASAPRDARTPAAAAGAPLSRTAITDPGALRALAGEWWALWRRCPGASPFQTPAWALAWWRQFGGDALWTVTLRNAEGRLVALVPLYVQSHAGGRTVRLIGAGLSDHLDALAEPGWGESLVGAVVAELEAHPQRWDSAEFQQLPAGAVLLPTDGRHADQTIAGEPCPPTIGVYYGFVAGSRAYYYLGGFDPAYRRYGVGNQLVAHAIAHARQDGAEVFDFLRGREAYKYRWGAKDIPTFSRRLERIPVLRYGAPEIFHVHVGNIPCAAQSVVCPAQTPPP